MFKFISVFMLFTSLVFADSKLFEEANKSFAKANKLSLTQPELAKKSYREALLKYQSVLKGDESSQVYYNIANTYFRLGDKGRAIYNYQQALKLDPLNEDIRHNLDYVRSLVVDDYQLPTIDRLLSAVIVWSKLPIHFQLLIVFVSLAIFFVSNARLLYNFSAKMKRNSYIALGVALLFILSSYVSISHFDECHDGVIVATQVIPRQGDGLIYEPAYKTKLHNGSEFVLLEDRGEWLHIELADQSRAWVQRNKVALW